MDDLQRFQETAQILFLNRRLLRAAADGPYSSGGSFPIRLLVQLTSVRQLSGEPK